MARLAGIYFNGLAGVESDPDESMRWLRLAAESGHGPSNYELGWCVIEEGPNSEEGHLEAMAYFREAAALGDQNAPL